MKLKANLHIPKKQEVITYLTTNYAKFLGFAALIVIAYTIYFCSTILTKPTDKNYYDSKLSELTQNQINFNQQTLQSLDALIDPSASSEPIKNEPIGDNPFRPL